MSETISVPRRSAEEQEAALYLELGRRVRQQRKTVGPERVSQEDLAAACGMNRATIAAIESGRQSVALHQIFRIAAALSVDPSSLIPPAPPIEIAPMLSRFSGDASSSDLVILSKIANEVLTSQEPEASACLFTELTRGVEK
jgi:transcriptional regulator with XRE-family HTH domain